VVRKIVSGLRSRRADHHPKVDLLHVDYLREAIKHFFAEYSMQKYFETSCAEKTDFCLPLSNISAYQHKHGRKVPPNNHTRGLHDKVIRSIWTGKKVRWDTEATRPRGLPAPHGLIGSPFLITEIRLLSPWQLASTSTAQVWKTYSCRKIHSERSQAFVNI
jgi:hypothetical protein